MAHNNHDYMQWESAGFIDQLYQTYKQNPDTVEASWRRFFEGMDFAGGKRPLGPSAEVSGVDTRVASLRDAYRRYGHLAASYNPLENGNVVLPKELEIETHFFSEHDKDKEFPTLGLVEKEKAPLSEIIAALRLMYADKIGYEFMNGSYEMRSWLQYEIEHHKSSDFTKEQRIELLHHLNRSEILEAFIHMKYPGQKRFSIEGGETAVPTLLEMIAQGSKIGAESFILGMAHRGRLNVLANVLKKPYSKLFYEFEPGYQPGTVEGSGDVKYHKGMTSTYPLGEFQIQVYLADNPSHLESVDPIVEGIARAQQQHTKNGSREKAVVPILIHGDASIAGQGVVYETLQLSKLHGYKTGGTIHLVINNQIGFTALPSEGRSTKYCTDIAHAFSSPVFHISAEDPESCLWVAYLAMQLRQKFGVDVFIDLLCYRKYGHNETDEPGFTQPLIYQKVKAKKIIRNIYRDELLASGILTQKQADDLENEFKDSLHKALEDTKKLLESTEKSSESTSKNTEELLLSPCDTKITAAMAKDLCARCCKLPEDFTIHPKLGKLLQDRMAAISSSENLIDWGLAEHLAYASLLEQGVSVRISGQDSQRGTFSHRHAALVDQVTGNKYLPLAFINPSKAVFEVYNSCLSEFAVLGFEYGFSLTLPNSLVIWEAQFGDFANGAQIIIDQYIASSEQKWGHNAPLTLFLPHGYEGQGPEHSSARMERFLQLSAEFNMRVICPSTPAQLFHALRKQVLNKVKKPLVVFMPKALLRYAPSLSHLDDFSNGTFNECIDDVVADKNKVKRLLLCSGKVYYDLIEERQKRGYLDVAIARIEQIYPLHFEKIKNLISSYSILKEVVWVQEEHANMGSWEYIRTPLRDMLSDNLDFWYVGRARSASTAAGSYKLHQKQRDEFLKAAFGDKPTSQKHTHNL